MNTSTRHSSSFLPFLLALASLAACGGYSPLDPSTPIALASVQATRSYAGRELPGDGTADYSVCVVDQGATVRCNGNVGAPSPDGLTSAVSLLFTRTGWCAIREDGSVVCNDPASAPVADDALEIAACATSETTTDVTTCLLTRRGGVTCRASDSAPFATANVDLGERRIKHLAGRFGTFAPDSASAAPGFCAVLDDGTVRCWSGVPAGAGTTVGGVSSAVDLTAGADFVCVRLRDLTVSCWGINSVGELGDGTTQSRESVATVPGLEQVMQIAAGPADTCARRADGSVWCWGNTKVFGTMERFVSTPSRVPDVAGATDIASAGYGRGCAVTTGGNTVCWGAERYTPPSVQASGLFW